jgi:hypothetical protein
LSDLFIALSPNSSDQFFVAVPPDAGTTPMPRAMQKPCSRLNIKRDGALPNCERLTAACETAEMQPGAAEIDPVRLLQHRGVSLPQ